MNFQMYDTAIGLTTTGMKTSVRSRYRDFRARLSASANNRPKMFVKTRNPKARNRVFQSDPTSSGVWKILTKFCRPTKAKSPTPDQFVKAKNPPATVDT